MTIRLRVAIPALLGVFAAASAPVFVPDPGARLQLAAGIGALGCLARRRARKGGVR